MALPSQYSQSSGMLWPQPRDRTATPVPSGDSSQHVHTRGSPGCPRLTAAWPCALGDLGDLKTGRHSSRVYRSTCTDPVRQAGCLIWGNERRISCWVSPPADGSSNRRPLGSRRPEGPWPGSASSLLSERRAGACDDGTQGRDLGSGRREDEERCRGTSSRDGRADPEGSGQLGSASTGNEDATAAPDSIKAVFPEGTPTRVTNLLA